MSRRGWDPRPAGLQAPQRSRRKSEHFGAAERHLVVNIVDFLMRADDGDHAVTMAIVRSGSKGFAKVDFPTLRSLDDGSTEDPSNRWRMRQIAHA